MEINITDDFDLKKIVDSGQCFRPKEVEPNVFQFITGKNILYISKRDENIFEVDCSEETWERVWKNYFDLETNYADIRRDIGEFATGKPYEQTMIDAVNFGKGIRILRQEPFEVLISFIISQRKNIPAIRSSVEKICERFGRQVGEVYLFPRMEDMNDLTTEDLEGLGLSYRKEFIIDALASVADGYLESLGNLPDEELVESLKTIRGVGDKVANCVALFAYHRVNRAPVDVWIKRAIDDDFGGKNIFNQFGTNAGILQQYIFYHKRNKK